jgi:hypothetical protein
VRACLYLKTKQNKTKHWAQRVKPIILARDEEDHGFEASLGKNSQDPISNNKSCEKPTQM